MQTKKNITRINLWSGPRNVSTALMYAFAQRSDTHVVDEPLYAHYLTHSNAQHPGQADILKSMPTDGNTVVRDTILGFEAKPVLFLKQMAHHLIALDTSFLVHCKQVLLIRHPLEVLCSYSQVINTPSMRDVGYQKQYNLYQTFHRPNKGNAVLVLEAKELLLNPAKVLGKLCEALAIPFEENMLSWQAGARREDGVWAKYWYKNVHASTGFQAYRKKERILPTHLKELLEECMPYYSFLAEKAIRA